MATTDVKVRVIERSPEKLNSVATKQVNDILEEATRKPDTAERNTGHIAYRVPFPGVRYYTFE